MGRRFFALTVLVLIAAPARADRVDLAAFACPGNPGAATDAGTLDCAGGQQLSLLVTFSASSDLLALTGFAFYLDAEVDGDLSTDATFWDFDNANHTGWRAYRERPASGCDDALDAWTGPGTAIVWGGLSHSGGALRLSVQLFRNTGIDVPAGQRVFGSRIAIDATTSAESGGTTLGCTRGVCMAVTSPSIGAQTLTPAGAFQPAGSPGASNIVSINGLSGSSCNRVPVRRHTWGQLKSLYR